MSEATSRNVLFICTGNTARSILAEGLTNHLARGRFKAYSAGSQPKGVVNPFALQTLATWHMPIDGFRSKSWDEFAAPGAPVMDFVFTVCDNAAGEVCPFWPGQPMTAHWGVADPAAVEGSDEVKAQAFLDAALTLKRRIELMLALPLASLDKHRIERELREIGKR
ncbi:MAG TPA: arsenate reductase ArsC [Methylibium sp.]|uniref:arsenate reductase ArsC n=1 Tax=Methylibium sp. TaxID=2067992 RepID=UPI002DB7B64B|nr:arsenate reductase ArsC [Methylibium sp.]HEU4459437.1 arsenate reductase ArsC [Methylibium sp.]